MSYYSKIKAVVDTHVDIKEQMSGLLKASAALDTMVDSCKELSRLLNAEGYGGYLAKAKRCDLLAKKLEEANKEIDQLHSDINEDLG